MRTSVKRTCLWTMVLAGFGTSLSVSAQGPGQLALPAEQQQVRRLTVNDAVRLAAENNLGIQIARYDPQIQDLSIAQARASYVPSLSSTLRSSSRTQPNRDFLSGAVTASDDTFVTNTGIAATPVLVTNVSSLAVTAPERKSRFGCVRLDDRRVELSEGT